VAQAAPKPRETDFLDSPVRYVKGVGEKFAQVFARLGITTVRDLVRHFPRRYEDRTSFKSISDLYDGEYATIRGRVVSAQNVATRKSVKLTKVAVDDGTGAVLLTWFNQPYLQGIFRKLKDKEIIAYGKVQFFKFEKNLVEVEWEEVTDGGDPLQTGRIVPIYCLTEGLYQKSMRKVMRNALDKLAPQPDPIPSDILTKHSFPEWSRAIGDIHFAPDKDTLQKARARMKFEEFFLLQTYFAMVRRQSSVGVTGISFEIDDAMVREVVASFHFELTKAQNRVVSEILADMRGPTAMNRLLQGDVGSGKTAVAMIAIAAACRAGFQAALMAPTEVLAEQHYLTVGQTLSDLGLRVAFLAGKLTTKEKRDGAALLESGEAQIAIGTHALIQEGVAFRNLGLVVIDEQHRFGVMQRARLRDLGSLGGKRVPDILVMTATPIPRTLAMTVHGDLDVSVIDEMPPGRKPVKTHSMEYAKRDTAYEKTRQFLREGRQAYVICPLVEESEKLELAASVEVYKRLKEDVFGEFTVGLLHGQMPAKEKEDVMASFRAGKTDVLASTTVIEVGIDVPNATVMLIENAERFGLAQLHQLRGRVGRAEHQSYCILLSGEKSDEAEKRLRAMVETTDGFKLAERDLEIRGPGDIIGTRQSGFPEFRIANILTDQLILSEARKDAFALIEADPRLESPDHAHLKAALRRDYAGLDLATVG
jgi:ATP-dependent DNA helicase RecG